MKRIKLFENFIEENLPGGDIPSDQGLNTSWTRSIDGKETTITLQDLNDYLDENNVAVEEIDTKSIEDILIETESCLLYTSPSPRDRQKSRMPSSA